MVIVMFLSSQCYNFSVAPLCWVWSDRPPRPLHFTTVEWGERERQMSNITDLVTSRSRHWESQPSKSQTNISHELISRNLLPSPPGRLSGGQDRRPRQQQCPGPGRLLHGGDQPVLLGVRLQSVRTPGTDLQLPGQAGQHRGGPRGTGRHHGLRRGSVRWSPLPPHLRGPLQDVRVPDRVALLQSESREEEDQDQDQVWEGPGVRGCCLLHVLDGGSR